MNKVFIISQGLLLHIYVSHLILHIRSTNNLTPNSRLFRLRQIFSRTQIPVMQFRGRNFYSKDTKLRRNRRRRKRGKERTEQSKDEWKQKGKRISIFIYFRPRGNICRGERHGREEISPPNQVEFTETQRPRRKQWRQANRAFCQAVRLTIKPRAPLWPL